MPGSLAHNPHEGSRSEYLAQYALSALGAVAPVPLRIRGVEEYLKGKEISENLADEAAKRAISGAIALEKNEYKLQITRALVKRAILTAKR